MDVCDVSGLNMKRESALLPQCYGLWDEDEPRSGGQTAMSQHTDADSREKEKEKEKSPTHTRLHSSSAVRRQSSSVSQRSARSKAGALLLCAHMSACTPTFAKYAGPIGVTAVVPNQKLLIEPQDDLK